LVLDFLDDLEESTDILGAFDGGANFVFATGSINRPRPRRATGDAGICPFTTAKLKIDRTSAMTRFTVLEASTVSTVPTFPEASTRLVRWSHGTLRAACRQGNP